MFAAKGMQNGALFNHAPLFNNAPLFNHAPLFNNAPFLQQFSFSSFLEHSLMVRATWNFAVQVAIKPISVS